MPLNDVKLKSDILAIFDEIEQSGKNEDSIAITKELFAQKLVVAISAYIKTGTVTTTVTGGSATGGPVTGTGTGTIS